MIIYFYNNLDDIMEATIANYNEASDEKKLNCLKFYNWAMENKLRRYASLDLVFGW